MTNALINKITNDVFYNSFFDDPLEMMVKDFFNNSSLFRSVFEPSVKINYPMDIWQNKEGIHLEIAAVGLNKEDFKIEVEKDILYLSHTKKEDGDNYNQDIVYFKKGITKKSFNYALKIVKVDFDKVDVYLDKGLLNIFIPWKQENEIKNKKEIFIK